MYRLFLDTFAKNCIIIVIILIFNFRKKKSSWIKWNLRNLIFFFLFLDSVKAEKKNSSCVEFNFTLFYLLLTRQTSCKNIRGIFIQNMERKKILTSFFLLLLKTVEKFRKFKTVY